MKHISHRALLACALVNISSLNAASETPSIQSAPEENFPIKLTGYIKHENYWDSRQVVGLRDDQFLIVPEKQKCASHGGGDINARGQFQMIPIQTRLRGEMNGPKIKKASSLGVIEGDFFGRADIIEIYRMRHAFMQLTWEKEALLLAGQTWHPYFVVGCEPRTISFNTGAPIAPFPRNPQIRFMYTAASPFNLMLTALTQAPDQSDGPIGQSSTYLRNAIVPMLDAQLQCRASDDQYFVGAGFEFKRLIPRLETDTGYKAHESINSLSRTVYAAFKSEDRFSINNQFVYAQNGSDYMLYGGYAVHCIDPISDQRTYTNIATAHIWSDFEWIQSKTIIPGLFIGFAKNLGSHETIVEDTATQRRVYGLEMDVANIFRVSPRCRWRVKNFELSAEVEYTRAAYGTRNAYAEPINTVPVGNTRLLIAMYYYL